MTVESFRRRLTPLLADYNRTKEKISEEKQVLVEARELVENVLAAQKYVQTIAEQVQQNAHKQIASVVTQCLQTVFGENAYTFQIQFSQKRGKTEAKLVFIKEGQEVDPTSASGVGVIDVASFALRLICLLLARPKRRRVLFLDEPFRCLSAKYRPELRALLLSLAKKMHMQFVMVTHSKDFQIGKVVEL